MRASCENRALLNVRNGFIRYFLFAIRYSTDSFLLSERAGVRGKVVSDCMDWASGGSSPAEADDYESDVSVVLSKSVHTKDSFQQRSK